jgi:DNA polymerase II large subunit
MRAYFEGLQRRADEAYDLAARARAKGFDPELYVEIPQTEDLASRVERLLEGYGVEGVAARIRALSERYDREEMSILVAKEMAARRARTKEEAIERAVRVGIAVLTEGILVAPLEGLAGVKVKRNPDGSSYVDLHYAGPIRSAGGTGQALSVLIADIVRRDLGIGRYVPLREEVERFKEEIPLYKQVQHLQYTPSAEEIDLIVSHCPVQINGEGTEEVEISGHRDLDRIETNRLRGGACLVVSDGLCLKAPKIQKHVGKLRIGGWEFVDAYLARKAGGAKEAHRAVEPSDKFIRDLVAGRPVLGHPSRKGGFRLRYGRTRASGLAAVAIHPAAMHVLGGFLAVGTQIRIERPGKAATVTPCDALEGPLVLLNSGDLLVVEDPEEGKRLASEVAEIVDLGEILIPYGEFLENNHVLLPGAYDVERYKLELRAAAGMLPSGWEAPTWEEAAEWCVAYGVPVHPRFNLFWHDLSVADLRTLRDAIVRGGRWEGDRLVLPRDETTKGLLVDLGVLHRVHGSDLLVGVHAAPLVACLGLAWNGAGWDPAPDVEADDPLAYVRALSGFVVRPRGPTRIGARMGRPEKAKERMMQPPPHALFPIGRAGGMQRLLKEAAAKGEVAVDVGVRRCQRCGKRWFLPRCTCGGRTETHGGTARFKVPLREALEAALGRVGLTRAPDIKAVKGMISASKTPEILEKGILRAKHKVFVFKDGTIRFDMTNLPLTHFRPREIDVPVERLRELGYDKDVHGQPLVGDDQLVEMRPQDFVASRVAGEYLLRVARFVDELLEKVYGLPPFYRAETPEDLVGHLLVGLAPHTSGGVLCRLIGYTGARAGYGHPYLHAARRRNADGDEDGVILLMDALLNFSRAFLPARRGGLMDAPLILTTRVDPNEIDKEAHNLDVGSSYPLAFYEATERMAHPREVEGLIDTVGKRVGSVLQYEGLAATHATRAVAAGPLTSAYTEGTMMEKLDAQLRLAVKIRAVDATDVVTRIVVHHFLPDLIGNLRAFSSQSVRCTKCNTKYRRVPLRGRCRECGGNLTLTVHASSVRKYLDVSKRIAEEYGVSSYLRQRLDLVDEAIHSLFTDDRVQELKLDDFL